MANVSSSNGLEKYPKLRFKGFSEPWKTDILGNLGTFMKGAPLSKADISEEGTPFILYGELYTTYSEVTRSIKRRTDKVVEPQFYSRVGDVIVPTSGETPEDIATASCIMLPDVILAGDLLIYRTQKVDGRLVSFVVKNKVNKRISSVAQGKSVVHVRAEELSMIAISYPSDAEQQKILTMLELIEDKIAKQRELIEHLKKYKRGLLSAVFSRELSFSDGQWISKPFSEFAHLGKKRYTPSPDECIPCIELEHIEQLTGRLLGNVNSSEQNSQKSVFEKGDVLFGKLRPYLKKYALPNFEGVCSTEIWVFKPTECITSEFLYYLVQSEGFINAANISSGTKMPRAEWSKVASTVFFLPNKEDQMKMVNLLMNIDKKINAETVLLEQLDQLKKAMLKKLFI